jgi:hypothetical protein
MVHRAPTFPNVLLKFRDWLKSEGLINEDEELEPGCCWCTDGVGSITFTRRHETVLRQAFEHDSRGIFGTL